jgi:hypothetical protein
MNAASIEGEVVVREVVVQENSFLKRPCTLGEEIGQGEKAGYGGNRIIQVGQKLGFQIIKVPHMRQFHPIT